MKYKIIAKHDCDIEYIKEILNNYEFEVESIEKIEGGNNG